MAYISKPSISQWPEEDRPREKLLLKGRSSLTDSEIIAILIGSGSREKSAVELAREILSFYKNDLNKLAKASVNDLMNFKGIGEAKAISIISALELGRRRKDVESEVPDSIINSVMAYNYFKPMLMDLAHEEFWILLLNQGSKPIKHIKIGQGGVNAVLADPKLVFKHAVENLAVAIILIHNHPSGKKTPSHQDELLTKKLAQASSLLDIKISDHIIFTDNGYYSFSDEGEL
jgi:DNA repair protein RadC